MLIKQTRIWKIFSSIKLAIWLLALIAVLSLVGTLIPQNEEAALYISKYGHSTYDFLDKIGLTDIYAAWWFLLSLGLLSLNLIVCLFNRFSLKLRLLGTLISHISILVIMVGALIGLSYGEKGYVRIKEGETINSFLSRNKKVVLDFAIRLDDFIYEEHIDPKEAILVYSSAQHTSGKEGELLLEVPVETDKKLMINDDVSIKILRYVPDFAMNLSTREVVARSQEPRNPAVEIELKYKDGSSKRSWVFVAYPDMHKENDADFKFIYNWVGRRPKDFISKVTIIKDGEEVVKKDIKVNFPLRFQKYAFFQSSYDKNNLAWSGLQVVKDPGVPIVYLGFIMLIVGLIIIFYINPLIKRRK